MPIRVTAPNRAFMGRINGDGFYRGVCDDAAEANLPYYTRQGFLIGDAVDLPTAVPPSEEQILDAARAAVEELDEQDAAATDDGGEEQVKDLAVVPAAPKRNAPRAVWANFLTAHGVTFADDDSRDDLIDAWEQSQ